jgi:PEGA domain
MKPIALAPALLACLISVHACGPIKPDPDMITIESEPAGATVYAMGKDVGVTPLKIRQAVVFPMNYGPETRELYGTVLLRKTGCRDYRQHVNTDAYRYGIRATLDCGRKQAQPKSVEQRLRQLKELHDQGLITDEEEKTTRRRILDGL